MKAILIDSKNKTVSEITIDENAEALLEEWYKHIDCELVQVAHDISKHDSILVDEEGLLKNPDNFFTYNGAHQQFAGNGLIVGRNEDGETVDCEITLEEATLNVIFFTPLGMKAEVKIADRLKVNDLKNGYSVFGNKGDVWNDTAHIYESGKGIMCGNAALSTNWARVESVEHIGCTKCLAKYNEKGE